MSLHVPFVPRTMDAPASHESPPAGDSLTLARWIAGILLRWRLVLGVLAASLLAAVAALLLVPPVYRAQAAFVTNGGSSGKGALAGALGGSGIAGFAAQLGVGGSSDPSESPIFYSKLLESRELLTRLLLSRFPDPRTAAPNDSARLVDLLRIREGDPARRMEKGVRLLRDDLGAQYDLKTNMVTVLVSAEWPDLAAQVANRTTALVNGFNLEQRQSRSRARRQFLEGRLSEAQRGLSTAEARLRQFYEINRQFSNSPQLRLREGELRRQVDIATDLFLTLQRERESAELAAVNDAALITIVDTAIPPRRAEWPRVPLALGSALVIGTLLGLLAAGLATVIAEWSGRDADGASALRHAVAEAWRGVREIGTRRPRPG